VELAHAAGVQAHVDAGDGRRHRELAHRDLPRPSARFEALMGVREREAQVGKRSVIGGRRDEDVGVLTIPFEVTRARVRAAMARSARLRRAALLRIPGRGGRHDASGRGSQHLST